MQPLAFSTIAYRPIPSPLGELFLATTAAGLCRVAWCTTREEFILEIEDQWGRPPEQASGGRRVLAETAEQLDHYFAGRLHSFDLPVDLSRARPFQQRVWEELRRVPYGEVVTYGELARLAGYPGAARAVGGAMRGNPLPIIIPCHRVLPASGGLGGFGGRPDLKRRLLELEGWQG